jgi:hypothetical protein
VSQKKGRRKECIIPKRDVVATCGKGADERATRDALEPRTFGLEGAAGREAEECCRPYLVMHLLSVDIEPNSLRIRMSGINSLIVAAVTLSTGITLLSEHVQQAAYYARGSFRINALIYAMSQGRYGAPEIHEQDFLCIHTRDAKVHVLGSDAAEDATALEEAGIRVYRSPLDYT